MGKYHYYFHDKNHLRYFDIFSIANQKKEEKVQKARKNYSKKRKGVYQHLGATLENVIADLSWLGLACV